MRHDPGPHPLVWTGDLTYWRSAMAARGDLEHRYDGVGGLLRLQLDLGMFPYFQYDAFWPFEVRYPEVVVESEAVEGVTRTVWRTPKGALAGQTRYCPESFSTAQTRYPIRGQDDLDTLCFILERQTYLPRLDHYHAIAARWGEEGYPSIGLPRSPMSSLMVEWAGTVNAAYLVADAPRRVADVLTLMERNIWRVIEAVIEARIPVVHFGDNLSSETATSLFDRFMKPYYLRALDRLHSGGVRAAVHLDGTVRGLLPKLSGVGFDAVESLTPAPVGDVRPDEMRALAGRGDLVLWGGVPGAAFSRSFPQKRFVALLEEVLGAWQGGPFILGTADQVPPDGDIERCRIVSEIVSARQAGVGRS